MLIEPRAFKETWKVSNKELQLLLAKNNYEVSEQSLRRYFVDPNKPSYRNPPLQVLKILGQIHEERLATIKQSA